MSWWHAYALVVLVALLTAFALAVTGCASSLPRDRDVGCEPTYRHSVWTGTEWRDCR